MKERIKRVLIQKRITIITLLLLGIFLNIFFTWFSSQIIMLSLTVLFVLSFWFYRWPAEIPAIGGFILLALSIFLSPLINNNITIDKIATWSYILIGLSLLGRLLEKEHR